MQIIQSIFLTSINFFSIDYYVTALALLTIKVCLLAVLYLSDVAVILLSHTIELLMVMVALLVPLYYLCPPFSHWCGVCSCCYWLFWLFLLIWLTVILQLVQCRLKGQIHPPFLWYLKSMNIRFRRNILQVVRIVFLSNTFWTLYHIYSLVWGVLNY